jgi:2-methylcitrate dehydratase PrpD
LNAVVALAEYVSRFQAQELPAPVQRAVRRCLLDCAGAVIAGSTHPAATAARSVAHAFFPGTAATVCGSAVPLSVVGAAFSNSTAASMLDVDDGHRLACGHPGAAIIPAALAMSEGIECDDATLLTAIAVGYEIGIRVAASRRRTALMSRSTGRWAGLGVRGGGTPKAFGRCNHRACPEDRGDAFAQSCRG